MKEVFNLSKITKNELLRGEDTWDGIKFTFNESNLIFNFVFCGGSYCYTAEGVGREGELVYLEETSIVRLKQKVREYIKGEQL